MPHTNHPEPVSAQSGAHHPPREHGTQVACQDVGASADGGVGEGRQSLNLRRLSFLAHWLYYAARHGTTKHATWACHHKGIWW